ASHPYRESARIVIRRALRLGDFAADRRSVARRRHEEALDSLPRRRWVGCVRGAARAVDYPRAGIVDALSLVLRRVRKLSEESSDVPNARCPLSGRRGRRNCQIAWSPFGRRAVARPCAFLVALGGGRGRGNGRWRSRDGGCLCLAFRFIIIPACDGGRGKSND